MARKKKKSYNPFKMWGSYVLAIIGGMIIPFGGGLIGRSNYAIQCFTYSRCFNSLSFIMLIFGAIIGFLIGWGIHSLFRRFLK